tara:strand:- start:3227 stop:3718 length:492 start_codon:yes stop_codon:yes gene_type:complete
VRDTGTGDKYSDIIANYIARRFAAENLKVYREVSIGKTTLGKSRRIDVLVISNDGSKALAIECKYQGVSGTVEEKIPYALEDAMAVRFPCIIVYGGDGFSKGVRHRLDASPHAVYCKPSKYQVAPDTNTKELDQAIAVAFGWWSHLVRGMERVDNGDLFHGGK